MTNQTKIVLVSITVIIATGLMVLNPSILGNVQAQKYQDQYEYDNSYKNHYQDPRNSQVEIQKISCLNDNTNINGIDITEIPHDDTALEVANEEAAGPDGANAQNGNGFADKINFNKNLVNICLNVNVNEQIRVTEPEPETTSLTVNKEVFGCNTFDTGDAGETRMRCEELQDDSSLWRPCADPDVFTNDPTDPKFCERLTENLFDIEVLDSQNTQLQQFNGSAQGTTIQNLQPGTYAVHEIKDESGQFPRNVLYENPQTNTEQNCVSKGFSDGGDLFNPGFPTLPNNLYLICFKYEDEQGNDCSTVTLAAGENKLCTVKNYIRFATN